MARFTYCRRVLFARWVQFSLWFAALRGQSRTTYRPLVRAEFAEGDFLCQAKFLHSAGYYKAAAFASRVAVEYRLYRYALVLPGWRKVRRCTIETLSHRLYHDRALRKEQFRLISSFAKKVNKHCHTNSTDGFSAGTCIYQAERCLLMLDQVAQAALRHGWLTPTPIPNCEQNVLPSVARVSVTAEGFELVSEEAAIADKIPRLPR